MTNPTRVAYGGTEDVRAMYETFQFPSPNVTKFRPTFSKSVCDGFFRGKSLEGMEFLDGGCGTGSTIIALAQRAPEARFTAVDMTGASLETARRTAEENGIENITFKQANIMELDLGKKFDVVSASGVVHHLEDSVRGLARLVDHLKDTGVLAITLYHSYGEAVRMLDRELLHLLLGSDRNDLATGMRVLNDLGLFLDLARYGVPIDQTAYNKDSANADGYLHPIVRTYKFEEALQLLKGAGLEWGAVETSMLYGEARTADLDDVGGEAGWPLASSHSLFKTPELAERFRKLSRIDRLRAMELVLKPNLFLIIGGKGRSHQSLVKRSQGNVIELKTL
jgi:trans-aconitate methyltransferase